MQALSLKKSLVDDYWRKTSQRMAKNIEIMESVEFWLLDENKEVNDALSSLTKALSRSNEKDIIKNIDKILYVMAYISSGKSLRLMKWFDEEFNSDSLTVNITKYAKENMDDTHNRLLLDRLQTVKSLSLMMKVFAANRSRYINEILSSNK